MVNMRQSLHTMRDTIYGAHAGDAYACNAYVNAYNTILYSGIFYDEMPGDWEDIDQMTFPGRPCQGKPLLPINFVHARPHRSARSETEPGFAFPRRRALFCL